MKWFVVAAALWLSISSALAQTAWPGPSPLQVNGPTAVAIVDPTTSAIMEMGRTSIPGSTNGAYVVNQSNPGTVASIYGAGTATSLLITGTASSGGALQLGYLGDDLGIGCAGSGPLTVCGGAAVVGANGAPITLQGQNGGLNGNGGLIVLEPGYGYGTGIDGYVKISHPTPTLNLAGAEANYNVRVSNFDFQIESNTGTDVIDLNDNTHSLNVSLNGSTALSLNASGLLTPAGGMVSGLPGSTSAVSIGYSGNRGTGMYFPSAGAIELCGNGNCVIGINGAGQPTLVGPVITGAMQLAQVTWADNHPCTAGQIGVDASYIYVCIATNTVERVALSSF